MQNSPGAGVLADCPARLATEILSDKWAALVIFGLGQGSRRHGELAAVIGGVSRKVLTQTLRRLQDYGLVERRAEPSRPIEYRLTGLGETLVGHVEALNAWASEHGPAVTDFQESQST